MFVVFLIGMLMGVLLSATIVLQFVTREGSGYFKVEPIEPDEELYCVHVCISPNQQLQKKKYVILKRDPSQK